VLSLPLGFVAAEAQSLLPSGYIAAVAGLPL